MSNARIVIVLFILSEVPVAWYAAQAAWRYRSIQTGRRSLTGITVGVALAIYGIARLMALTTAMQYGALMSSCLRELEARSLMQTVTQTTAIYIFAFAFTGDDHPGWIRRGVNKIIGKAQ